MCPVPPVRRSTPEPSASARRPARKQILDPLPTEPLSWGQAINTRGDVLGYSFVPGGRERIGYWRDTTFVTSFVEGTPQYPTVSNRLLWNEVGLIVITRTNDLKSYIVPKPGVRLNLADLTTGPLPVWTDIEDVNNLGDLLGAGGPSGSSRHTFLLERTDIPGSRNLTGLVAPAGLRGTVSTLTSVRSSCGA